MAFCGSCGSAHVEGAAFCTGCGSPVARAAVAPQEPAGTEPQVPVHDVPAHPAPTWSQPPAPAAQPSAWPAHDLAAAPVDVGPAAADDDDPATRSRAAGAARWGAVALGVGGIAAVGWFVVSALVGGGGADSPEEAVRTLADAIEHEDPAAALSVLAPDEVRLLDRLTADSQGRAAEFGLVREDDPFAGIDLDVEDLTLRVEQVTDDVARVVLEDGRVDLEVAPDQMTDRTRQALASAGLQDGSVSVRDLGLTTPSGATTEAFVMVVRQDGGWYVSPGYTAGQVLTEVTGSPEPTFSTSEGVTEGDADPDAAVRTFLQAAVSLDPGALGAAMPAGEGAGLVAYRRTVNTLLERSGTVPGSATLELTRLVTDVEDLGDGVSVVTVRSASGSLFSPEVSSQFSLTDSCLVVDGEETCLQDLTGAAEARMRFVTVEDDGRWTVSAAGTVAETLRSVVGDLDETALLQLLGLAHLADPAATFAPGEQVEVTPQRGIATALLEVQGTEPVYLSATFGDDGDDAGNVRLFDPDGTEVQVEPSMTVAPGTYTVLVESYVDRAGTALTLRALQVAAQPMQFQAPVSGELRPDAFAAAYEVTVPDGGLTLELDAAGAWATVYQDGSYICSVSSDQAVTACEATGTVQVLVLGDLGPYTLAVTPPAPAGVDGQASVNGFIGEYETGTHTVTVPAYGTVEIVLTPSSGQDLVLEVDDPDQGTVRMDPGGSGASERYTLTSSSSLPAEVTIRVSGYNASRGDYRVDVFSQ